jgi:cytochrome c553
MRALTLILLTYIALPAAPALAEADPQAGRAAYAVCGACHGAAAEGNAAMKAPRLNHLSPGYLASQLDKFRRGMRGGKGATAEATQMAGMAATLADADAVNNVAAYISSLGGNTNDRTVEGDVQSGADYYNQFCGACHGPAAEGNPALNSPALAGGDDWYLLAQLRAFRDGVRGAHPEDQTGRQMRAMAVVLPDEQALRDVVAFIGSLPP